jgi:hypothetical protein
MDLDAITKTLDAFVKRHQITFVKLGSRQTQILELAAIVGVSQHYVANAFDVEIQNPRNGSEFVVKSSTRGHPSEYSRVACSKATDCVELHTNVSVRGAHDQGVYCVDVGIVEVSSIPRTRGRDNWTYVENSDLRSFVEVKKLVVYPMLLAQFLGIVHEIKPEFLSGVQSEDFGSGGHLPPTLISLGRFSGNSRHIAETFVQRGFNLLIATNFDVRLARCRSDTTRSPFYDLAEDVAPATP